MLSFPPFFSCRKISCNLCSCRRMKNASALRTACWYLQEHIRYENLHSMKRKLSFRDCSMGSSAEVSCNRFGTFCKIDHGSSTPLKVHLPQCPHATKAFHWVLVRSACFLQQEKLSSLSSFSLSCHLKEQLEQNNDEGNNNFKKREIQN